MENQVVRVGVVGSRTFSDYKLMVEILDACGEFILVSGGARGADKLAERYADDHGYQKDIYIPDWDKFGRSAGYRRNRLIVDNSDMVIAFWDGKSLGTKHTIDLCNMAKLPVEVIRYE